MTQNRVICRNSRQRKQVRNLHLGSFAEAQRWVRNIKDAWGNQDFDMIFDPCGAYVVLYRGSLLSTGVTYESALSAAENEWRQRTGELSLDGLECV